MTIVYTIKTQRLAQPRDVRLGSNDVKVKLLVVAVNASMELLSSTYLSKGEVVQLCA